MAEISEQIRNSLLSRQLLPLAENNFQILGEGSFGVVVKAQFEGILRVFFFKHFMIICRLLY